MKRIAICISGEPRMYDHTYQHVHEYFSKFVEERTVKDHEEWSYDIFIHAWTSTSTARNYQRGSLLPGHATKQKYTYDVDELRNDLIQKYRPKRILVETKDVLHDLANYYQIKCSSEDIVTSNFLAMSQHISGERAAYLKTGKDIILPSNDIIGDDTLNDYDIVVKTRFDVRFFSDMLKLHDIFHEISRFESDEALERTPTGMTYFPSVTIRKGRVACEFGHFWSNNKQFDMIYDSMFRKLHDNKEVDIYESCHHWAFASHCLALELSMRQWNMELTEERDFIWVMPNVPPTCRTVEEYNNHYINYKNEHSKRMSKCDKLIAKQEQAHREQEQAHREKISLVKRGVLKDVWYKDTAHFVQRKSLKKIGDTDVIKLDTNDILKWNNSSGKWIQCSKNSYEYKKYQEMVEA